MNEAIKKPYEISLWADLLQTSPEGKTYYEESKIAIIGSNNMTSPNRAFEPILTENINGELELSFSMKYRYWDEVTNEEIENPFISYLINERKIKLYYQDKWYDFVIKECEEGSEEYTFQYTARGLFALELGKVGYNLTFDSELNNNQGTITELAQKILESTDWQVDVANSDILKQRIREPLYKCTVSSVASGFRVLNLDTNKSVGLEKNEVIYVFYNYIANKNGKFIQFIREKDRDSFQFDDNDVITSTNYRITNDATVDDNTITIGNTTITIGETYNQNQAYRLVYQQLTTYDPITEKVVKRYKLNYDNDFEEIYSYTDSNYITSDVVMSYVTNGADFEILSDIEPEGWSAVTPTSNKKDGLSVLQPLAVTTYPLMQSDTGLSPISNFADIRSYLELKFAGVYNSTTHVNTYFNSGFEDNLEHIDHITAGEKFALRLRYGYANSQHGTIQPYNTLTAGRGVRAIVARYTTKKETFYDNNGEKQDMYGYNIDPTGILLDFNGAFQASNNYITGGTFNADKTLYMIDGVVETPSTQYCYKTKGDNTEYIWDSAQDKYIAKDSSFLNYYITTATAKYSISNTNLLEGNAKLGIFLYTPDSNLVGDNKYIYIEDVQIMRYYVDGAGAAVTPGNAPTATSNDIELYYFKTENKQKEEINLYGSLDDLVADMGLTSSAVKPIYNENCEKYLSIKESQSNCFNILQTLCETFECWLKLEVAHNEDGSLLLDKDYKPIKTVVFKEYIGKENFAGFKYGINLNGIQRTIDSNEFVTKLIVDIVQNEYTDSGVVSIQNADSNPSKESYILDFSYYLNRNLIVNKDECNKDINQFNKQLRDINVIIQEKEKEKAELDLSLTKLKAKLDTLDALIAEAQREHNSALTSFSQLTNMSYETFVSKYNSQDHGGVEDYLDNETVTDLVGQIYETASVINNYSGVLTNLNKEYNTQYLKRYGAREFGISITTTPGSISAGDSITKILVDDYIKGLSFTVYNDQKQLQTFTTGPNDKFFEAKAGQNMPFQYIKFESLPANYEIQYYVNGIPFKKTDATKDFFIIYGPNSQGIITQRYRLVPTNSFKQAYPSIDEDIEKAKNQKADLEKNFYEKYSRFIQEGTWNSTDYIDSELYYLDALQVSRTSAQPKVSYTIDVSEVSGIEELENYYFEVGDQTYIEDSNFFGNIKTEVDGEIFTTPIKEQVIVSIVEWHLDDLENNKLTIQNYKTQFEDLFQRVSATVQTLQFNEATYPKTSAILGTNGLIDRDLLLKSWNDSGITGYNLMSDGSIVTDSNGILIQDLTNSTNRVRIDSRGLKTSSDGGQTWNTIIDGTGIKADALTAGKIDTQKIWLMDGDNPSFRWDKFGLNAYGFNQNKNTKEPYDLKTYVRFDKYGLYGVQNGSNFVASSLEDIKKTAKFGLTWDGFFIKNSYTDGYVSISSDDDFQIVTTDTEQEFTIRPMEVANYETVAFILDVGQLTENVVLDIPYDNIIIMGISYLNEQDEQVKILNFTVQNGFIYSPDFENGVTYTVDYVVPLNSIDLGGKGILKINSVQVNYHPLNQNEYVFNNKTGILYFKKERFPGEVVTVNYQLERIKIGATNFLNGIPSKYGIEVRNRLGETVFETNDEGNLSITGNINATNGVFRGTVYAQDGEFTGHIRATSGDFPGSITVGREEENHIIISGENGEPYIASKSYLDNEDDGWIINGEGDAVFNNVDVRGTIRTSVFVKGEIQTVGGAFLFRPSDAIERAAIQLVETEEGERADLVLTMKQEYSFRVGDLCKLGEIKNLEGGLQTIFEVTEVSRDGKTIVLAGAGDIFRDRS